MSLELRMRLRGAGRPPEPGSQAGRLAARPLSRAPGTSDIPGGRRRHAAKTRPVADALSRTDRTRRSLHAVQKWGGPSGPLERHPVQGAGRETERSLLPPDALSSGGGRRSERRGVTRAALDGHVDVPSIVEEQRSESRREAPTVAIVGSTARSRVHFDPLLCQSKSSPPRTGPRRTAPRGAS